MISRDPTVSSRPSIRSHRATTGRFTALSWRATLVAALIAAGAGLFVDPASASITSITTRPEAPTVCDPVGLVVKGTMPDPCYNLIGAEIRGPVELPTMGPIPTYEIRIRLTVQEPNPALDIACPTVLEPYEQGFRLGILPSFGRYFVHATEYLVPFSPDSSAGPKDSTTFDASFDVPPGTCTPGTDCFILSFGASGTGSVDSTRLGFCDVLGRPGGTGCFDVSLLTHGRVGGVQTQVMILDPRTADRTPPGIFHPISVEAVGRASAFQTAWTTDGSTIKILLFSSTGGAIEPGDGPILHVCYEIGADAPRGRYPMHFAETIVADPAGTAIPACPTFAEIVGAFCVGGGSCDLNEDLASDIRDIVLLVRCALSGGIGGTVDCPDPLAGHADCNGDGSIDIRDIICCVRGVLEGSAMASTTMPALRPPDDPTITDIRFEGPVQWTSASSGWVMLQITPGIDVAGIQFSLGSGVRVRGMTLVEAEDGVTLEWALRPLVRTEADGDARGMLYRPAGDTRLGRRIRIRVDVDATWETAWSSYLTVSLQAADVDGRGTRTTSGTASIPAPGTLSAPTVTSVAPNPFATETEIAYSLPAAGRVTIRIYDATGRLVRTLVDSTVPAGVHRSRWDGKDNSGRSVASGPYFFQFKSGTTERTQRILRLR